MANVDRPSGLVPSGTQLRLRPYRANAAVKQGDAVKRVAGVADTSGRSSVTPAAAGDALIGVAAHAAAADGIVMVWDHPDQEFVVQASGSEVNNGADIGKNYSILATAGAGDISANELDSSTGATTAALELKLLRVLPAIDNALGAQVKCVVKINNHQLAAGTGTAGV